jgi:hypothetical protein
LALVVYENKIVAIAGESEQGVTGDVNVYDPETDVWESLPSKPTPVADIQAVVIGGKIYIPGGRLDSGEISSLLEIFDPGLNRWSSGARLPERISAYGLVAFEGELYLFGGWNGEEYLDLTLKYDPDIDEWTEEANLSTARAFSSAIVAGEKVHLIGGYDGNRALDFHEVFTPGLDVSVGDAWTESTPLPDGRYAMGATSLIDVIYLVGGVDNGQSQTNSLGLQPQIQEWQAIPNPFKGEYRNLGLVSLNTRIYAVGGLIDDTASPKNMSSQVIYIQVLPFVR